LLLLAREEKKTKEMILRVLNKHIRDVFVFETEKTDNLSFFIKHSKLPVLVDDEKVKAGEEILSFGFDEKNDVFASDIKINGGINFKVNHKGSFVPFWTASSGEADFKEQILPVLPAVCVGTFLGLNLVEISQSLK